MLPIAAYFLLTLNELTLPFLRKWFNKAGIIFVLTTFAEICQFFGIEVSGVTFNLLDMLVYGISVLVAVFLDVRVLAKYFDFGEKVLKSSGILEDKNMVSGICNDYT